MSHSDDIFNSMAFDESEMNQQGPTYYKPEHELIIEDDFISEDDFTSEDNNTFTDDIISGEQGKENIPRIGIGWYTIVFAIASLFFFLVIAGAAVRINRMNSEVKNRPCVAAAVNECSREGRVYVTYVSYVVDDLEYVNVFLDSRYRNRDSSEQYIFAYYDPENPTDIVAEDSWDYYLPWIIYMLFPLAGCLSIAIFGFSNPVMAEKLYNRIAGRS